MGFPNRKSVNTLLTSRGVGPNTLFKSDVFRTIEKTTFTGVTNFTSSAFFSSSLTSPPALLPTGSATMSFGISFRYLGAQNLTSPIPIRFGDGATTGYLVQHLRNPFRLAWQMGNKNLIHTASFEANKTYTLVGVLTGGTASFYVNGALRGTVAGVTYTAPTPSATSLMFGASSNGTQSCLNFTINAVAIANFFALSATDVSGWDLLTREYGPGPFPSGSTHFWSGGDVATNGIAIGAGSWIDRVNAVPVLRASGSILLGSTYVPVQGTASFT